MALKAEEKGWLRRKLVYQNVASCDIIDFPKMAVIYFKILFKGTYQFSQAILHLTEMINIDETLKI